ncbi:MAG: hypothetical protein D6725_12245 [Planctomycetota bacterium]|nr:MAG: hypothetical protein D6725_12245 [Planctomycetota bacterium]
MAVAETRRDGESRRGGVLRRSGQGRRNVLERGSGVNESSERSARGAAGWLPHGVDERVVTARFALAFFVLAAAVFGLAGLLAWGLVWLWPQTGDAGRFRFPPAFFWTTLLLAAVSGWLEAARDAVRRERQELLRVRLALALFCATAFCGGQTFGIRTLILSHRPEDTVLGLNAFVVALTAMHALHVSVAVLFLVFVTLQAWRGRYDHEYYFGVVVCAWFWHVLAIAWGFVLVIFLMGLPLSGPVLPRATG